MSRSIITINRGLLAGLLLALGVAGTAYAHGEMPANIEQTFAEHISTYEAEVQRLSNEIDAIVAAYADGEPVLERVKALVPKWEHVKFHPAVETLATPLYPPVWSAIGQFVGAVEQGADVATLRQKADAFKAALNQGLGALKYAAQHMNETASHAEADEHAVSGSEQPVQAIIDALHQSVELYEHGKSEQALELISNTYLQRFEMLEGTLIQQDAALVADLEMAFNATLPNLIRQGAPVSEVRAQVAVMQEKLEHARELLEQAEDNEVEVF